MERRLVREGRFEKPTAATDADAGCGEPGAGREIKEIPSWRGCRLWGALPLGAAIDVELARWRSIMSILSWKNQQDDAAKGRNGAILTASSNEPYIWFLIFRPGAHVHDALRVVG
jgi:hypothetical protein